MAKAAVIFHLFLILSINPLMARRQLQATDGLRRAVELRSDAAELQEAIHALNRTIAELEEEEAASRHRQNTSYWGESWASCSTLLEDFGRRSQKLKAAAQVAQEEGDNVRASTLSHLVHKTVRVVRTLKWGVKHWRSPCSWTDNTSEIPQEARGALMESMQIFENKNRCFAKARANMQGINREPSTEAEKLEVERQVHNAFLVMTADERADCVPRQQPDHDHESLEDLERETNIDESSYITDDVVKQMDRALSNMPVVALLDVGALAKGRGQSFQLTIQRADSQLRARLERRFRELIDAAGQRSTADFVFEILAVVGSVIGLIVTVVLLMVLCSLLIAFFWMLFGFILCLLKFIALWIANAFIAMYRLVSRSGTELWRPDLFKCSGWWWEALDGTNDGFSVALCVVALLSRR